MFAWVPSRYPSFLPQPKDMQVRLIGYSPFPLDVYGHIFDVQRKWGVGCTPSSPVDPGIKFSSDFQLQSEAEFIDHDAFSPLFSPSNTVIKTKLT